LGKIILTQNTLLKNHPYPGLSPNLKPDLGKGENLTYLSPPFLNFKMGEVGGGSFQDI
jgi:hypothetical protein